MTLDEAIVRYDEKADHLFDAYEAASYINRRCDAAQDYYASATANRQIANWLKELKGLRANQKTSKWVVDEKLKPLAGGFYIKGHCASCGFYTDYSTDDENSVPSNFCPNCGAKLD